MTQRFMLFMLDMDLNSLIKRLKHDSSLPIEWFENNKPRYVSNQGKCHLLVSGYKDENVWANIRGKKIGKVISRNF